MKFLNVNIFKNIFYKYKKNKEKKELEMIEASKREHDKQVVLKKAIWDLLVADDYKKNHLEHYSFTIDNKTHVLGIIELISIFGSRMFYRIEEERLEIEKIKKRLHLRLV